MYLDDCLTQDELDEAVEVAHLIAAGVKLGIYGPYLITETKYDNTRLKYKRLKGDEPPASGTGWE